MASSIYQHQLRASLLNIFRRGRGPSPGASSQLRILRGLSTGSGYHRDQEHYRHHQCRQLIVEGGSRNINLRYNNGRGGGGGLHLIPCGQAQHRRGFKTFPGLEATHRVNMPSLSPTMTEGTIVKWMKKEGDPIAAGDVLCEIQTDKAVVSMEYDEDGILAKILVPENTPDVKVGKLIALTVEEGEDWQNVEVPADTEAPPPPPPSQEPATQVAAAAPKSRAPAGGGIASHSGSNERLVGPAVKNYLRQYGLDSGEVSRSGPHGVITKGDVLKHVQANNMEPVSADSSSPRAKSSKPSKPKGQLAASFVDLEISNIRKTIAKRLLQSKSTIPHAYAMAQCNVKNLVKFRKSVVSAGFKVSVNDIIIKCVANALALNPAVNSIWEGDQLKPLSQVDISIAVSTPNGLITPIVSNAAALDLLSIADAVRGLAAKARDGKLQPHEFMGGSFCISNLGMFGIHSFSAIINPPQCAILAVGGTITELGEDGQPLNSVKLMLSYDASAISEYAALRFLAALKIELENVNEISTGVFNVAARLDEISAVAQ